MLPIVQDAIARDRKLAIRYRPAEREREERSSGERVVDPLGLVAKGSTWYLVAGTANGFRTFRVSRMESAVLLDSPSHRPPQFDLEKYWKIVHPTVPARVAALPRHPAVGAARGEVGEDVGRGFARERRRKPEQGGRRRAPSPTGSPCRCSSSTKSRPALLF